MINRRWLFFLMIIGSALFLVIDPTYPFNDTPESRETLCSVSALYVVIDGVTPELEQNGLSAKQLKRDVELQLKKAGIQVMSTQEKGESVKAFPAGLYVRINTLKSTVLKSEYDIDYYAITISVELIQRCLPLTKINIDPSYVSSHSTLACTWSTNNIYLAGEERLIDIRDCVQELVGHFIDAYVSVNPKQ